MSLTKKANGEVYNFASEELVASFVHLCKEAGTEDSQIIEMLNSLESSKLEKVKTKED